MNEKFIEKLKEKARSYSEQGGSHEFSHTERVYKMAVEIAKEEKADIDIVQAAAILHDIARIQEDNGKIKCHAEEGAKLAKKILADSEFPKDKIEKVSNCIKVHRHSKGIKPSNKEEAIIQDADRLDALGAITIARMFSTGGKMNIPLFKPDVPFGKVYAGYMSDSTIHAFHTKILKIKPELFNTGRAKEIAKGRYIFVEEFLDRFVKEWEGKL